MSRAIVLGNGKLLVGLDDRGQVRDLYFPFIGHSDHVSGASGSYVHRIGVWTDEQIKWLSDSSWNISIDYSEDSGTSIIEAKNNELGVTLNFTDTVHNEQNVFIRKVLVTNDRDEHREIKIFFGQEFRISESRRGDTAYYDPRVRSIIHYKGHNAFLIHATLNGTTFSDYSIGLFNLEGRQGTYTDAEDGILSKNPIEHGSVDSVIGLTFNAQGKECGEICYWIAIGESIADAQKVHTYIVEEKPGSLIDSTDQYWRAWTEKESRDLTPLSERQKRLYKRSLAIIRIHADSRGGIIASSDSDMLNHGRDTYSYVWPRDAAISAHALDRAKYNDVSARHFSFMAKCLEEEGYLMHKYRVDGVLGSSWHPWVQNGILKLPIQEDETATTLYMLAIHYEYAKDLEFIESLYNTFVEPAADFLCTYTNHETGLPIDSYDLWEEKFGASTYTAASVYGGLHGAATLSAMLGKRDRAKRYRDSAERIKKAILTYLYDAQTGMFIKLVRHEHSGNLVYDRTVDISSIFGIVSFGVLDVSDSRVMKAIDTMLPLLKVNTQYGGYIRYVGDQYYRTNLDSPSNPWCITTLWVARLRIATAKNIKELEQALEIFDLVCDRATTSGLLPEQIHPYTAEHLSTTPLVWSHAEFVIAIDEYLKKYAKLKN